MTKSSTLFVCTSCDAQTAKWSGRCSECGGWGTLTEHTSTPTLSEKNSIAPPGTLLSVTDTQTQQAELRPTSLPSLDLVLGGGLVDGSVTLFAGEPGVGKSTLLAQLAILQSTKNNSVIYVTGEESPAQVRRRLERLGSSLAPTLFFLNEIITEVITATLEKEHPSLVIVDSIQTLRSLAASGEAGNLVQLKACAAQLTETAKRLHLPIILVGQVTKDGDVAGPRALEHIVDTVLFLEGDHEHRYRLLRALKHRFGSTDEIALLRMTERGLEEVQDPSKELLDHRATGVAGSAVSCLMEGHRPLLLEIQALVTPAGYGTPTRKATGIDITRLSMLLAILARRGGISILDKDVYVNVAGGMDAKHPSVDLAIALAIASAATNRPLDPRLGVFGELGLAGELRPVSFPELRLKEFQRMGFVSMIIPHSSSSRLPPHLLCTEAATLKDALTSAGIVQ